MASKRLGEFLKEQQQPFVLEAYLSERGYSTPNINRRDSTNKKKKKKKALFPFSKILTALHKKLAFQNKSRTTTVIVKNSSDTRNKHANVGVSVPQSLDQTIVETDRFSTASSSTLFNSCSDIDEDDTNSLSSHNNNPLFFSDTADQSQQDTSHGKCCQRSLEVCVTHGTYVSVWGIEQRIDSCGGEEEDSVLSAALWSSIIVGHEHDVFKSKKVLRMHKTKQQQQQQQQLLFDCVKEITINVPRKGDDTQKGCKKIMGPEKMGKIIWEKKTKEWSQHETNLDSISMNEWSSNLLKDISVEIADAILQQVNDEMVSEMIEFEIS